MTRVDDFEMRVLVALVEGYAARAGMKDRIRALNEWEIARRSGFTELSYAEYLEHPLRDQVMSALLRLQRAGLVQVWERGVKYDSFVPTEHGTRSIVREPAPAEVPAVSPPVEPGAATDPTLARLDEIIRLLRSIDAKLSG